MTSGLRWPWCVILSRHGSRGRTMCKSSVVFSWGYSTSVPTTCGLLWSSNEKTSSHTQSDTQTRTHPDAEAQTRGGWNFHVSHMTALLIIELSGSSLWCAHRESLTCQTLHFTHIYGYKLPLMQPRNMYMQKYCRCKVMDFEFLNLNAFCMFPQFEQMGLVVVCLSYFLVALNSEALRCLSLTQITENSAGMFSLLKCILCLFCTALLV